MTYTSTDTGYLIRLFKNEKIVESLIAFSKQEDITSAQIRGIGGVTEATIGFYDLDTREYEFDTYTETLEVLSLLGNISLLNNEPFLHAHITVGRRDKSVIGGHLNEAVVGGTVELEVRTFTQPLHREKDEETGLSLWELTE